MNKVATNSYEEYLNALSHAVGAIFGVVGFLILMSKNTDKTAYAIFSILVYSFTFILMFSASTLYHTVTKEISKRKLRILDHICIYFLIAGTYTPMALITLINGKGWMIFYTVWSIAALGTLLKLFFTGKYESISLALYLAMGWLIVLDFDNVLDYTSSQGIQFLIVGGAFYTLGIIFYAIEKIPYNHFIWHLFVLAGAFCHWVMIYLLV